MHKRYKNIDGKEYVFTPYGYCDSDIHRGYLTKEQYEYHDCKGKDCASFHKGIPSIEEVEESKKNIIKEFHSIVFRQHEKQEISKRERDRLKAIDNYVYAYCYIRTYNNAKLKKKSDFEDTLNKMLVKSGIVTEDELRKWNIATSKDGGVTNRVIKKQAYMTVDGEYKVFIPTGYCKKHKCYLSDLDIKNHKCKYKYCEWFSESAIKTKKQMQHANKVVDKFHDNVAKLYNEDKITGSEFFKLMKINSPEYARKFNISLNEDIVLRDYNKNINEKVDIKEPEYVDIKIKSDKPLTWCQKVIRRLFRK